MMAFLFDSLDCDRDGRLSREDLRAAAVKQNWGWYEAPLFAFLDLCTIPGPLTQERFAAYMQEIGSDPLGPYGRVLRHAPSFAVHGSAPDLASFPQAPQAVKPLVDRGRAGRSANNDANALAAALKRIAEPGVADGHKRLLEGLNEVCCATSETAVLLIDPQRSFTSGAWMRSIGSQGAVDVTPIKKAFIRCARLLAAGIRIPALMFTRCPFPPDSYDWDQSLDGQVGSDQLYFIKPGNSVLFPPLNGFREWVAGCLQRGIKLLVMGGCTLNSCVRVSAMETYRFFHKQNLQVVVDMSLCGARLRSYLPASRFGGLSAMASAVAQMTDTGVQVVRRVKFQ